MSEKLFNVLQNGTLPECYYELSKFERYRKNDEHWNTLKQFLPELVTRTKLYISTLTASQEIIAKTMKHNFDDFNEISNKRNDKEVKEFVMEINKLWSKALLFYKKDFDLMFETSNPATFKETTEVTKKRVAKAVIWFDKTPPIIFQEDKKNKRPKEEIIQEILRKATMNDTFAYTLSFFVFETLSRLSYEKDYVTWKKKIFTYENGLKCSVLFYNDKWFVDHYGNVYLSEMDFLRVLQKFTGFKFFKSQNDDVQEIDESLSDVELFENLKNSFNAASFKYNASVFTLFPAFYEKAQMYQDQAVKFLKKIRAIFQFFWTMNKFSRGSFPVFYVNGNNRLQIRLGGRIYDINDASNIYDYLVCENFLKKRSSKMATSHTCLDFIVTNSGIQCTPEELVIFYSDWNKMHKFHTENYKIICYVAAARIMQYLIMRNTIQTKSVKLTEFKYILLWVESKFLNEKDADRYANFNDEEMELEFTHIMQAILNCEKSEMHQFLSIFSAAYHFSDQYETIRETLLAYEKPDINEYPDAKNFPVFSEQNLTTCATYYLKNLLDIIFQETFKRHSTENYTDEGKQCFDHVFEKFNVTGIKSSVSLDDARSFITTLKKTNDKKNLTSVKAVKSS